MPKLRNGASDVEKLAQWVGRKCRNHHPLEEVGAVGASRRGSTYRASEKGKVSALAEDPSVVLYEADRRVFAITVVEVDPSEYADKKRVRIGS